MKTIKAIQKDISKNWKRQTAINEEIERLSFKTETRRAAQAGNYNECKRLHEEADKNAEKITALCDELTALKFAAPILRENLKAATVAGCLDALREIMPKYDGKQYGEKTAEKIREELKKLGFSAWFAGYLCDNGKTRIEITLFDGKYHGSNEAATVYCKHDQSNGEIPFITGANTINAAAFDNLHNYYKYVENVPRQVRAIRKAIEAHRKASKAAYQTQTALNELLSRDLNHVRNIEGQGSFEVCGMYF